MPITPEQLAKAGTEHAHQCALFCFCASSGIPELKWLFAIPNGEQRTAVTGARLKAAGVKRGVPDLMLPVPRNVFSKSFAGNFHGLFLELKKSKKGVISPEQSDWLEQLAAMKYATRVCFGWEEARDCLLEYLNIDNSNEAA